METEWKEVPYKHEDYSVGPLLSEDTEYLDLTPVSLDGDNLPYNGSSSWYNLTQTSPPSNVSDYYYDYDASINNLPVEEITLVALVYGLTLVLGVLGNGLVIITIIRIRRMQSITNIFLTSLASADLLLLFICVPIKFAKWFSFTWDFGLVLCKAVHYLQNVSVICSVLTLTTMSMERYYAICHPMKAKYKCTKHRARRIIMTLWLLSAGLASPIIYGQIHKKVGERHIGYWCIDDWRNAKLEVTYALYMFFLVLVLPLVVMTIAYTAICQELWNITSDRRKLQANGISGSYTNGGAYGTRGTSNLLGQSKPHADTSSRNNTDRTRKQVIKILVTIIVLFTICWGPTLIDQLLAACGRVDKLNYEHLKPMRQAFALMSYFNSCVNPIVYAFMSKHWRESFTHALCCRCAHTEVRTTHCMEISLATQRIHRSAPVAGAAAGQRHGYERNSPLPPPKYPNNSYYSTVTFVNGRNSNQIPL